MKSSEDKEALEDLKNMVGVITQSLLRPKSQFQDAFFFPNYENVKKLQNYIRMAAKTIDLAIFYFTNDDLANEILDAWNRGVKIRVITDDQAMKSRGADT